VDYTKEWSDKAEIPLKHFISWLVVSKSKFYTWIERYGKANEHNAPIPRDFWLAFWEREAIIKFAVENPLEGYRRLTFMMLDQDIVAVSPSSTWRVNGIRNLHSKEPDSYNRCCLMNTGMWMFLTSTSVAPSTTCAASWMVAVAPSSIGRSESG
jgi:hypothetical protein